MYKPICGDCVYYSINTWCHRERFTEGAEDLAICPDFERKIMVQTKQLKITAEINGEQVPLKNISTETFEAIKALEKPKEIPVARIGNYKGNLCDRRLFLKLTNQIKTIVAKNYADVIAIDLRDGLINNTWRSDDAAYNLGFYENVRPL